MRFFVIRHGETAWNVEGRFQGQKDTALNEKGLAQAATLGERLAGHSFEAVLTSPSSENLRKFRPSRKSTTETGRAASRPKLRKNGPNFSAAGTPRPRL